MVAGLLPRLDLPELHPGVMSGGAEHGLELFRRGKMGAGAGGEVAAVLYQTQTANIDLAVALDGIFDRAAGFCEGRRIEDHDVKLLTSWL